MVHMLLYVYVCGNNRKSKYTKFLKEKCKTSLIGTIFNTAWVWRYGGGALNYDSINLLSVIRISLSTVHEY